jgi:hypothetical protein
MTDETETTTGTVAPEQLLALFDRVAAASADLEMIEVVGNIRTTLDGTPPSIILKQFVVTGDPDLSARIRQLETERDSLRTRLAAATGGGDVKAENGHYDIAEFLRKLFSVLGRTYGARKDYVAASETTPGCRVVKNEEIQRWQQSRKVPAWAYEQIDRLVYPPRKGANGPNWSDREYNTLVAAYLSSEGAKAVGGDVAALRIELEEQGYNTDSTTTNAKFSEMCTTLFGRDITENSIRGAIDRKRKEGRLPKLRKDSAAA